MSIKKKLLELSDIELDRAIRIQGTDFDRKRKLTQSSIRQMHRMYEEGVSLTQLSDMFGVTVMTVKYNVDDTWRNNFNKIRSGKHTGVTAMNFKDRVNYKRKLINVKSLKELGVV